MQTERLLCEIRLICPFSWILVSAVCRDGTKGHVGVAGVVDLPAGTRQAEVAAWLAEACEFVAEWVELRSIIRKRLIGTCLRSPLQVPPAPFLCVVKYGLKARPDVANVLVLTEDANTSRQSHMYSLVSFAAMW